MLNRQSRPPTAVLTWPAKEAPDENFLPVQVAWRKNLRDITTFIYVQLYKAVFVRYFLGVFLESTHSQALRANLGLLRWSSADETIAMASDYPFVIPFFLES